MINPDAQIPIQGHHDDRGFDVFSTETTILPFGENKFIGTGLSFEPETGHSIELHLRSKLGSQNVILTNSVGVIDHGYRGELKGEINYIGKEIHPLLKKLVEAYIADKRQYNVKKSKFYNKTYILEHLQYGQIALKGRDLQRIINNKRKFNQGTWLIGKGQRFAQITGNKDITFEITVQNLDNSETTIKENNIITQKPRDINGFGSTGS